jgi:hypothetical protein
MHVRDHHDQRLATRSPLAMASQNKTALQMGVCCRRAVSTAALDGRPFRAARQPRPCDHTWRSSAKWPSPRPCPPLNLSGVVHGATARDTADVAAANQGGTLYFSRHVAE